MLVLVGDTNSPTHIATLQRVGWARLFLKRRPRPFPFERWGLDNGAFEAFNQDKPFPEAAFLRRVEVAAAVNSDPYLAVVPDIVAGGLQSLEFSLGWRMSHKLPADWPWYLAVQDGMTVADVEPHLHLFAGVFLGGTDRFKRQAYRWAALAHKHRLKFHYGRASTPGRLMAAFQSAADSCDSAFPLWTQERMQTFVWRWQGLGEQTVMSFEDPSARRAVTDSGGRL